MFRKGKKDERPTLSAPCLPCLGLLEPSVWVGGFFKEVDMTYSYVI